MALTQQTKEAVYRIREDARRSYGDLLREMPQIEGGDDRLAFAHVNISRKLDEAIRSLRTSIGHKNSGALRAYESECHLGSVLDHYKRLAGSLHARITEGPRRSYGSAAKKKTGRKVL
jgi:hypothetical protein